MLCREGQQHQGVPISASTDIRTGPGQTPDATGLVAATDDVTLRDRSRVADPAPPAGLIDRLVASAVIDRPLQIDVLAGGRTNRSWRLVCGTRRLVLKLYAVADGNLLFPNDPCAEATCLAHHTPDVGKPEMIAQGRDPEAGDWLISSWIDGAHWAGEIDVAARLLGALHRCPPPKGLRRVDGGSRSILDQGAALLAACSGPSAQALASLRPDIPGDVPPLPGPALLHGDPVASNIILARHGPVLIDWQCPASGDPCHDIAILLSPAMRLLYGGGPVGAGDHARFLAAYGDAQITARYHALRPLYHWRMAAYCLWRSQVGVQAYSAAVAAELSELTTLKKSSRPTLT